jgi:hypothetical protein
LFSIAAGGLDNIEVSVVFSLEYDNIVFQFFDFATSLAAEVHLLIIYLYETGDDAEETCELVEVRKELALVLFRLLEYITKRLEVCEVFDSGELEVYGIANIVDRFHWVAVLVESCLLEVGSHCCVEFSGWMVLIRWVSMGFGVLLTVVRG